MSKFRGVSRPLCVDFRDRSGRAQSIMLLGDNGTGKSSIADALEFCLRGKVSRRGNAGVKNRREARNLLVEGPPYVTVELDNGKLYGRGHVPRDFSGSHVRHNDFVPGFGLAPVVLSRADIEVFWQITPADRMRFFFDYLRETVEHAGYAALEAERTEKQITELRAKILSAQILLSGASGWPVMKIPTSLVTFNKWLRSAYPDYGKDTDRGRGGRGRRGQKDGGSISEDMQKSITRMGGLLQEKNRLVGHLRAKRAEAGVSRGAPAVLAAELPTLLREVSEGVTSDFISMAQLDHINGISIKSRGAGYALDIGCLLPSGLVVDPTQILSEGALDLLALLILLGVARACARRGQISFLVLDDVWQSVDTVHRGSILDYLFSGDFNNWQLLITVHDRLWARLIENRARLSNSGLKVIELTTWSSSDGPQLRTGSLDTPAQLSKLISEGVPEVVGSYAGRALEQLADELSQAMRTSISRTPGDRYALGDLWPGIFRALRKSDLPQESKDIAEAVERTLVLRNLYAAHYQAWAESLSFTEVNNFAKLVVSLWNVTHCDVCGSPFTLLDMNNRTMGWPCGHSQTAGGAE